MMQLILFIDIKQSIKGEKSAIVAEDRGAEMEDDEHAVHQFQVATGKTVHQSVFFLYQARLTEVVVKGQQINIIDLNSIFFTLYKS